MANTKVILLQDVAGLGTRGAVVEVKPGYARNYLLPRGLAKPLTPQLQQQLATEEARAQAKREQAAAQARTLAEQLRGQQFIVRARAGEGGRLFGAVTNKDVAEVLAQHGYVVEKRQVEMEPLHHLGEASAIVRLYANVQVPITVRVLPQ